MHNVLVILRSIDARHVPVAPKRPKSALERFCSSPDRSSTYLLLSAVGHRTHSGHSRGALDRRNMDFDDLRKSTLEFFI
jgi:hypothetical protein